MMNKFLLVLFAFLITSCGSTKSLTENNLVPFAIITLSDSTTISGQLITDDEKHIVIMRGKSTQIYKKTDILSCSFVDVPSEQLMMRDMVLNVSRIASAYTVAMMLTFISFALSILY